MKYSLNDLCPCSSLKKYEKCCYPYHRGKRAETPELLMRSRYSGYACGQADYILKTTHPDHVELALDKRVFKASVEEFIKSTQFLGLTVTDRKDLEENEATVTFTANLSQAGHDISFTEVSLFKKEGEDWYYLRGEKID